MLAFDLRTNVAIGNGTVHCWLSQFLTPPCL